MVDEETAGSVQGKDAIIESLQAACSKHGNALFEFKKRIKELETTCAKQSERIAELDRLLGRTEESSAEQYERARKAEAENVKLREALLIYGKHRFLCPMNIKNLKFVHKPCNCDWEKVKAALGEGDGR